MKLLFNVIILVLFAFSSCTPPDYIKSSPIIPVFDTANQLNTTVKFGSVIEYQGSYSITNKLGLFGGIDINPFYEFGSNQYYECGLSYTHKGKIDFINLSFGMGSGKIKTKTTYFSFYPTEYRNDIDLNYKSLIIQPSYGKINSKRNSKDIFTLRINLMNYSRYKFIDKSLDVSAEDPYDQYDPAEYYANVDDVNVGIWRIGLFYSYYKTFKHGELYLQTGAYWRIINQTKINKEEFPENRPFYYRIGFNIPIVFSK